MSALLSWDSLELRCIAALFPLTLTLSLRERTHRTLCAPCALEPTHGPLTPSLSPSEGERVPEGRQRRRFMGREQPPTGVCFTHTGLANSVAGMARRRRRILPLPRGEGRGEGEEAAARQITEVAVETAPAPLRIPRSAFRVHHGCPPSFAPPSG